MVFLILVKLDRKQNGSPVTTTGQEGCSAVQAGYLDSVTGNELLEDSEQKKVSVRTWKETFIPHRKSDHLLTVPRSDMSHVTNTSTSRFNRVIHSK
jgi:hypothetical protein